MKAATIIGVVAVLALTLVSPSDGGPSIHSIDRRERAHYKQLTNRVNALAALYLNGSQTKLETANMSSVQNSAGSTFYTGTVDCPPGHIATGGGTDWGYESPRGDWLVNYSHPTIDGEGWEAGLFAGQTTPTVTPRIYVVCLRTT